MNWQEAVDEIRSVEFDIKLNVVSGTNGFLRAVSYDTAVLEAYRLMRQSGELREDALGRIYDLVKQETDPSYENPNDTSLAVLLWLTAFASPEFATIAASWVDQAPRCWHAKRLAQRVLNPPPSMTGSYKLMSNPREPYISDTLSGDMRFTMSLISEYAPKFHSVKLGLESSTPDAIQEFPEEFIVMTSEGTS